MIELNKIYNEDCLLTMQRMIGSGFMCDLIVTSPPYNMRTRIRNGEYTTRETSEHFSKKYKFFDDALPIYEFYEFHSTAIKMMLSVSPIVCYNFQIVTGSKEAFFKIIGDFNKYIKDIIIWDKGHGQPAMHANVMNSCYEMVLILESDANAGRVIHNSFFERGTMPNIIRPTKRQRGVKDHGAMFSYGLSGNLILAFSQKGDTVYDPFMGTGSTAESAIRTKRNFIGSEMSEEYCNIANKRLLPFLTQPVLL